MKRMAILFLLALTSFPAHSKNDEKAWKVHWKFLTKKEYFGPIQYGLQMFRIHNGRFPSSQEGLKVLQEKPGDARSWKGPYLKTPKLLKDYWGTSIKYKLTGKKWSLRSAGPDKKFGTEDDVVHPE